MMANFSCYYSVDYGPLHPLDDTWETQFKHYIPDCSFIPVMFFTSEDGFSEVKK